MLAKPSLPRDSSAAREGIILLFDGLESNEDVDIPSWGAPGDPHELEMALFERRGLISRLGLWRRFLNVSKTNSPRVVASIGFPSKSTPHASVAVRTASDSCLAELP